MDPAARDVSMASGSNRITYQDRATEMTGQEATVSWTQLPFDGFASGAADFVYQEVARCLEYKCATETMDEFFPRGGPSRRKAESEMQMGRALSGAFAPALSLRDAPPPRTTKSLVLASAQGDVGISAVGRRMRRFSGSRGGADRQAVSGASYADAKSKGNDYVA